MGFKVRLASEGTFGVQRTAALVEAAHATMKPGTQRLDAGVTSDRAWRHGGHITVTAWSLSHLIFFRHISTKVCHIGVTRVPRLNHAEVESGETWTCVDTRKRPRRPAACWVGGAALLAASLGGLSAGAVVCQTRSNRLLNHTCDAHVMGLMPHAC